MLAERENEYIIWEATKRDGLYGGNKSIRLDSLIFPKEIKNAVRYGVRRGRC